MAPAHPRPNWTRVISTLPLLVVLGGCTRPYPIVIGVPQRAAFDASSFQRIVIPGFLTASNDQVDLNLETVRLLRSQLRTSTRFTVVETQVVPLSAMAVSDAAHPSVSHAHTVAGGTEQAPPRSDNGERPAPEDVLFARTAYWSALGEEYPDALIVTGSIKFGWQAQQKLVQDAEVFDQFGRRRGAEAPHWRQQEGFVLQTKFVFIDGRTGRVLHSVSLSESAYYEQGRTVPALSSYFELMDRVVPHVIGTLATHQTAAVRLFLK